MDRGGGWVTDDNQRGEGCRGMIEGAGVERWKMLGRMMEEIEAKDEDDGD